MTRDIIGNPTTRQSNTTTRQITPQRITTSEQEPDENKSGLAETNSNWHHKHLTKNIITNATSIFTNASVAFSNNSFNPPDRSSYLPGGCLQICTGHWIARIIETIHDP
jgi:hypothetical protein